MVVEKDPIGPNIKNILRQNKISGRIKKTLIEGIESEIITQNQVNVFLKEILKESKCGDLYPHIVGNIEMMPFVVQICNELAHNSSHDEDKEWWYYVKACMNEYLTFHHPRSWIGEDEKGHEVVYYETPFGQVSFHVKDKPELLQEYLDDEKYMIDLDYNEFLELQKQKPDLFDINNKKVETIKMGILYGINPEGRSRTGDVDPREVLYTFVNEKSDLTI